MSYRKFVINEVERDEETVFFTAEGVVSSSNDHHLETYFNRAIEDGCINIIIDMSEIDLFTSAGIRVVLKTHKNLKEKGGCLKIKDPSSHVEGVLGMVALDELLLKE